MSILITGAGLIAAHVARELQAWGEHVALYDLAPPLDYLDTVLDTRLAQIFSGEITDVDKLATLPCEHRIELIVHTAALIGSQVSRDPLRGVDVNVGGSMAVIEAARQMQVRRVVFCSSMAVYDFDRLPSGARITEDCAFGPKNLYAATKAASEYLLSHYGSLYDIDVVHLRLAGVYGRGQFVGGSWMGKVLHRLIASALAGTEEAFQPEWIGTNEYVYVKDVAQAFRQCCHKAERIAGAYNIGTGALHTYAEVLDELRSLLPDARIRVIDEHAPMASYLVRDQAFDISKARQILGYRPRFSLRAGLQDYIEELRRFGGKYTVAS